ncbi:MAG: class I SAM-dependent methyltransferase [Dehalococcoidia bacterium]
MTKGRISQSALKVAIGFVTLNMKDDWAERLPAGTADLSERLVLASGARGYGPRTIRLAKQRWMLRVYALQDKFVPGQAQFEAFGYRKIFVQEKVDEAIAAGARQVLVLGAGFDTLCLRLAPLHPDLQFLEVDHPATSEAKARGVREEGEHDNLKLVAADLGERPLSDVLAEQESWDPSRLSVIVAEGLFLYLRDEEVHAVLREAAACAAPGSRLVFSHMIPTERKAIARIMGLVGEPFRSSVASEDLPEYVAGTGWEVVSGVDTDPAHGMERFAVAERR